MLQRILILGLIFSFPFLASAQDDYHQQIQSFLASDHNATGGQWMFTDNELDNNNIDANWGPQAILNSISDQIFNSSLSVNLETAGANPWDAGMFNRNQIEVSQGDVVFCTFFIRAIENAPARASVVIEDAVTFNKEFFFEADIPTEWTRYFIKFESTDDYEIGDLNFGFQYGTRIQGLEIGGFTALNFADNASLDQLPIDIHNDKYGGYEATAPWRSEAADRIQNLRMSILTINATDPDNNPLEDFQVEVKQKQHKFKFGTAVNACQFANNSCLNEMYQSKLENLDGRGNRFNMIVFENDTKWPNWENEYSTSRRAEIVKAVDWARQRDIEVRGHTLVWPGNNVLPNDIAMSDDLDYIQQRINSHIEEILNYPDLKDKIVEWDVINEIATNRDLENKFAGNGDYVSGRELYKEIFDKVKEVDPDTKLFLNDFVTLSTQSAPGAALYDRLHLFLAELVDSGAPVEGLGFQGHIGGFPNSINDVEATLNDFYQTYNLPAKITEFDLPDLVSEELAADYLRDFMTMIFSHPSMEGFLFWSFWDGATYRNPGANLFRQDWTMTPAGETFIGLVFDEWWTNEQLEIVNGMASTPAFKGRFEIAYQCNEILIEEEFELNNDTTLQIVCDGLGTSVVDNFTKRYSISPNPSTGEVIIARNATNTATLQIFNPLGQMIISKEVTGPETSVQLDQPGIYTLSLDGLSQKVLIQ